MKAIASLVTAVVVGIASTSLTAQDREFLAAMERAQKERPKTLSSSARIAPESEPGDPLVVHGRAIEEDGKTPVGNAIIFAYHTDRNGLYDVAGSPPHQWRLKGWVRTAADGTFEFRTIRPGAYPENKVPQHIHLNVFLPDGRRYWADELQFADDPLLPASDRATAVRVRREGGTQHVDFVFRLRAANKVR